MDNQTKVKALLHGRRTEGFTYPRTRSDWCRAEDSPLKDECIRVGPTQLALRGFPVSSAGRTGNHAWLLCWLLLSKKHLSHVGLLGQVRICHCHHCFFPNILNSWSTCKATSSLMQDSMSFLSPFLPTAWFVETLPPRRHWCHLMCPYILSFPLLGGPQFPNKCRKKLID